MKVIICPLSKDAVCLVESGPVVIERGILKSYHCVSFVIYLLSSLGKSVALHLNKFEYHSAKKFCAKFGWNCMAQWFIGLLNVVYVFLLLSPLEKSLNKLESHSPKNAFCQIWNLPIGFEEEDENVKH